LTVAILAFGSELGAQPAALGLGLGRRARGVGVGAMAASSSSGAMAASSSSGGGGSLSRSAMIRSRLSEAQRVKLEPLDEDEEDPEPAGKRARRGPGRAPGPGHNTYTPLKGKMASPACVIRVHLPGSCVIILCLVCDSPRFVCGRVCLCVHLPGSCEIPPGSCGHRCSCRQPGRVRLPPTHQARTAQPGCQQVIV